MFFKKKRASVDRHPHDDVSRTIESMKADLDKATLQIGAFSEMMKFANERFSKMDEQLGVIRGSMTDKEKDIKDLELKAISAADLVHQVQPEKLMMEVRKQEAKSEAISARIESYHQISEKIMEELRDIRGRIQRLTGVEEIVRISREMHRDVGIIQKVKAQIEMHAKRIEKIYVNVEKRFYDFEKYRRIERDLEHSFDDIRKQFDDLKIKYIKTANHDDFASFKASLEKRMDGHHKSIETHKKSVLKHMETHTKRIQKVEDHVLGKKEKKRFFFGSF
ncbi:MAG: hypothetical protein ABH879_08675 [archaeon]